MSARSSKAGARGAAVGSVALALGTLPLGTLALGPIWPAGAAQAAVDPALYQALHWRSIGPFRGGRVLAVTAVGADLAAARQTAYERVAGVRLAGAHWRSDIALAAVEGRIDLP